MLMACSSKRATTRGTQSTSVATTTAGPPTSEAARPTTTQGGGTTTTTSLPIPASTAIHAVTEDLPSAEPLGEVGTFGRRTRVRVGGHWPLASRSPAAAPVPTGGTDMVRPRPALAVGLLPPVAAACSRTAAARVSSTGPTRDAA